jgi:hypothetical protein
MGRDLVYAAAILMRVRGASECIDWWAPPRSSYEPEAQRVHWWLPECTRWRFGLVLTFINLGP